MKKILFLLLLVFLFSKSFSQQNEIKKTISDFFVAFHAKDTLNLKSISHSNIIMQTVINNKASDKLVTQKYSDFLKSIASIPATMKFEERILDYKIESNNLLAHVWTPYEFYLNDELSHKGVNSFTLIKENEKWVIVHVIDTRSK